MNVNLNDFFNVFGQQNIEVDCLYDRESYQKGTMLCTCGNPILTYQHMNINGIFIFTCQCGKRIGVTQDIIMTFQQMYGIYI